MSTTKFNNTAIRKLNRHEMKLVIAIKILNDAITLDSKYSKNRKDSFTKFTV